MRLVFIHIPKTGGIAVREALVRARPHGPHVWDYGAGKPSTSEMVKQLRYAPGGGLERLCARLRQMRDLTFCGHVRAGFLTPHLGTEGLVTILRDPVERVISNYAHERRCGRFQGSLCEFAGLPQNRNLQARMVGKRPLEDWLLVAAQERLDRDLAELSELAGVELRIEAVNVAPAQSKPDVSPAERALIAGLNAVDGELYARAFRAPLRLHRRAASA